jgi:hypothetical protein
MEINSVKILAKVFMKNKELKKKLKTIGHLAWKRDQVVRPSWVTAPPMFVLSSDIDSISPSTHVLIYLMTHKYRGLQQSLREVKPKFIDSTQGEPKNIYKP